MPQKVRKQVTSFMIRLTLARGRLTLARGNFIKKIPPLESISISQLDAWNYVNFESLSFLQNFFHCIAMNLAKVQCYYTNANALQSVFN